MSVAPQEELGSTLVFSPHLWKLDSASTSGQHLSYLFPHTPGMQRFCVKVITPLTWEQITCRSYVEKFYIKENAGWIVTDTKITSLATKQTPVYLLSK